MADVVVRRSGQTVSLSPDDCLVVTLPDLGGAGYEWSVLKLPPFLEVESIAANYPDSDPQRGSVAPGAAGQWRVVIRAQREGEGAVVLKLARRWETSPAKTFRVDVKVTP